MSQITFLIIRTLEDYQGSNRRLQVLLLTPLHLQLSKCSSSGLRECWGQLSELRLMQDMSWITLWSWVLTFWTIRTLGEYQGSNRRVQVLLLTPLHLQLSKCSGSGLRECWGQLSELRLMQDMSWMTLWSWVSSARAKRMSRRSSRDSWRMRGCWDTYKSKQRVIHS